MKRLTCLAAIALIGAALTSPGFGQSEEEVSANIETLHGDANGFFELFSLLQEAMMFGDPVTIADNVSYPITISANGEVYDVFSEQDMIDNFETLFQAGPQEALRTQDVADLIVTSDGVGFGAGEVWVANICTDNACNSTYWAITAVNN